MSHLTREQFIEQCCDAAYAERIYYEIKAKAPSVLAAPIDGIRLDVPYFSQHDNASGQGYRECFSSTCAMAAAALVPDAIASDDAWNERRRRHGDSTQVTAQVATFSELGIKATFHQNGNLDKLKSLLARHIPVPIGWFHNGPWQEPRRDHGHWSLVVGFKGDDLIVHDPAGAMDTWNGGEALKTEGFDVYKYRQMQKRFEADGTNTGWFLALSRPAPPRFS